MDKDSLAASAFKQIPLDFHVKVVAVAGSMRMTVPWQLAKELMIRVGDTLLVSLVEVGQSDTPTKAMLVRKKGK